MSPVNTLRAAAVAALVATAAVLVMGFTLRAAEPGLRIQPSVPAVPAEVFVRATNAAPELALRFFAADSLFILSYLMVFVGLAAVVAQHSPGFARLGLAAGTAAAALDAIENAFFINYASLASAGVPLSDPALPLIFNLGNLKWMAAFAALYAFGLPWPREGALDWVLSGLMLLFPLFGVIGVAQPDLIEARGLFFLVGMPLFAWTLWRRSGQKPAASMGFAKTS